MSVHMMEAVPWWHWVPEAAVPLSTPGRSSVHQWDTRLGRDSSHPPVTLAVPGPWQRGLLGRSCCLCPLLPGTVSFSCCSHGNGGVM